MRVYKRSMQSNAKNKDIKNNSKKYKNSTVNIKAFLLLGICAPCP